MIFFCLGGLLKADELIKRTQVMMGTYVSISLPKNKVSLSTKAFERLKEVEMGLSSYDENAQVYQINHNKMSFISKDTYEALVLSKQYYHDTKGYFDITIGSITKGLFHFGEDARLPSKNELSFARVDFKGLHFNKAQAWIDSGIKLDLGGMGKGYGVDKAVELLKEQGVTKGVVALSGDIFCFHQCFMAIQDPFSSKYLADFYMAKADTSISTSGNYRRYVQNTKYNHLINPKTKTSQRTFASITLLSRDYSNADLDAYATATSVMPKAEAFTFLKSLDGVGYLVVTTDKKIYMNEALRSLTKQMHLYEKNRVKERSLIYLRSIP